MADELPVDRTVILDRWSVHHRAVRLLADRDEFHVLRSDEETDDEEAPDSTASVVAVEWLPTYAPDLNPVEGIWSQTKYGELDNFTPHELETLKLHIERSVAAMQNQTELSPGYIRAVGLEFFALIIDERYKLQMNAPSNFGNPLSVQNTWRPDDNRSSGRIAAVHGFSDDSERQQSNRSVHGPVILQVRRQIARSDHRNHDGVPIPIGDMNTRTGSVEAAERKQPPSPRGFPIIGNTLGFVRDPFEFFNRCVREHGDVVHLRIGFEDLYLLNHPDYIKHVLVDNNRAYVKGELIQRGSELFGRGILLSEGEFWRHQRHLINPAFDRDRIATYATKMTASIERQLAEWEDGETINVVEEMRRLTLEIITKSLFDIDIRDDEERIERALNALDVVMHHFEGISQYIAVPRWLPTPENRRYRRALATLDEIVYWIIHECRRRNDSDNLATALLNAEDVHGRPLTEGQVRDEILSLIGAGHETTTLALSFIWYLLARHPAVETELLNELDTTLDGRKPTMADLPNLPYTERVVKEALRLYPPIHGIIRESTEDDEVGEYLIPAGATVLIGQWLVHRDPRWYDDPLAFKPERWTDAFERNLPQLAYFPFAAGPRRCIGDRFAMTLIQLVLAMIAQRYHFELLSSAPLELAATITTRPKDDIIVRLHDRDVRQSRE